MRPVMTVFGAVAFGVLLAGGGPQVQSLWDRPACAEKVMQAVSTDSTISGSYGCFTTNMQTGLQTIGVDSDNAFAAKIGQSGEYHFVHKTADGGYIYEYDRPMQPHDKVKGAISALGLPRTSLDVRRGDFGAAWNERHDLGAAWAEITGQTQQDHSQLFTFYLDGEGKVSAVK
ncbi:MAG: hypothetical protein AUI15_07285 [Actinobacteria bacterium 13_2_20CM_2_66_6]|nr:MAG: hypothetical protein AUI15_07285 [Actinobacteria bacterium 13_2_20CM_2_66_6]